MRLRGGGVPNPSLKLRDGGVPKASSALRVIGVKKGMGSRDKDESEASDVCATGVTKAPALPCAGVPKACPGLGGGGVPKPSASSALHGNGVTNASGLHVSDVVKSPALRGGGEPKGAAAEPADGVTNLLEALHGVGVPKIAVPAGRGDNTGSLGGGIGRGE